MCTGMYRLCYVLHAKSFVCNSIIFSVELKTRCVCRISEQRAAPHSVRKQLVPYMYVFLIIFIFYSSSLNAIFHEFMLLFCNEFFTICLAKYSECLAACQLSISKKAVFYFKFIKPDQKYN